MRQHLFATWAIACYILISAGCAKTATYKPTPPKVSLTTDSDFNVKSKPVFYPDNNPSVPDGKAIWEAQNCAQCHGTTGTGTFQASDITHKPVTIGRPVVLYQFLAYGLPNWDHPRLKEKLTDKEIWDLVFYCRSFTAPPATTAELEEMEPVFGANCADCHGERGYGDGPLAKHLNPLSANFHQYDRFFDREDTMLYNHISEGLYPTAMPPFLGRKDPLNGVTFNKAVIDKLVSYVRHFHVDNFPTYLKAEQSVKDQK